MGEQQVHRVVGVGVQNGQRCIECGMRSMDGLCESDAKPNVDMSVAGLSAVCTVAQSEARLHVLPTPGQPELTSRTNVAERSATTGKASQPYISASEKVFGYKTKFKSIFKIDGLSKGKFTLKKAKGGPLSNISSEKFTNISADSQLGTGSKIENIAHMFGGVKGKKNIIVSSTLTKRNPEGEVGSAQLC